MEILKKSIPYLLIFFVFSFVRLNGQNLLNNPESVVYDPVSECYLASNWADGNIISIDINGQQQLFNDTLQHVAGLHIYDNILYACSYSGTLPGIVGFDLLSSDIAFYAEIPEMTLPNGITSDSSNYLYVTAYFANKIIKINLNDSSYITLVNSGLNYPNGIEFDFSNDRILVMNEGGANSPILEIDKNTGAISTLVETGISACDGLTIDNRGYTYFSSWARDKVYRYAPDFNDPPELVSSGHSDPADIFFNKLTGSLAVPNFNSNSVELIQVSYLINVPGDEPTIQAGIDRAQTGDTVLIAAGTYYENINFRGKNIVLTSNFVYSSDFSDIENTIINGSIPERSDTASCILFCSGEDSTAVIQGFTITEGTGTHWIDPQFPAYTWHSGGGILMFQSSPTIKNNYIIDNHVDDPLGASGASGGGICTYGANPFILNNIIKDNTALYGAGLVIDYSGAVVKNNIIAENIGGQNYGGAGFWTIGNGSSPIIIENNIIVNNESFSKGGAMYLWSTHLTARNNIIWGNIQASGDLIHLYDGSTIDISYSDIEGGYTGEGNIDDFPGLTDDFLLEISSPCIDAGDPSVEYNDIEDAGNIGYALYPSLGTLRNDMGVYGGQNCMLLKDISISIKEKLKDNRELNFACFPNPFTEYIEIEYSLTDAANIDIIILDSSGHTVKNLLSTYNPASTYSVIWTGFSDSGNLVKPGIYFIKLKAGEYEQIKKVVFQN